MVKSVDKPGKFCQENTGSKEYGMRIQILNFISDLYKCTDIYIYM